MSSTQGARKFPANLSFTNRGWTLTSGGTRYSVGNNFRIDGSYFGGTSPANDITISVTKVNSYGAITEFTVNGDMPYYPTYKTVTLDFADSANYVREASELTTATREVKVFNENRSGTTITGQKRAEVRQGNQYRLSYLFGMLKSGGGFGGPFNLNGPLKPHDFTSPTPTIVPTLFMWHDTDDSSTMTLASSRVTQLRDKSGNGYHLVPRTGAPISSKGPLRVTTVDNPRGFDLYFDNAELVNESVTINTSYFTDFIVFKSSMGQYQRLMAASTTGINYPAQGTVDATGFNFLELYGTAGSRAFETLFNRFEFPYSSDTYHIISQVFQPDVDSSFLFMDGSRIGRFSCYIPKTFTKFAIGNNIGGGNNASGLRFDEYVSYTAALTPAQRQTMEGYLAWKWGIQSLLPANHPYLKFSPISSPLGFSFNPSTISGLVLWLDAAAPNAITLSGSSVTKWSDKSGRGNNLVNATGYQIPNYNSSEMNGSPTVSFFRNNSGSFSVLENTAFSGLTGNSLTLLFVAQRNLAGTSTTYQRFISAASSISGADNNNVQSFNINSGNNSQLVCERFSSSILTSFTTTNAFLGEVIVNGTGSAVGNFAATTSYVYANGIPLGNAQLSAGNNFSVSHLRLGSATANPSSNDRDFESLQGNISEMILFPRVLTTTEFQQVEGYLAWKWNLVGSLPTNHPYFSVKP